MTGSTTFTSPSGHISRSSAGRPVRSSPSPFTIKHPISPAEVVFTELRSCVKVEVAVPISPSLIVLMVSVDVKQRLKNEAVFAIATESAALAPCATAACKSHDSSRIPSTQPLHFCARWQLHEDIPCNRRGQGSVVGNLGIGFERPAHRTGSRRLWTNKRSRDN